jgi:hypothetical protein
MHPEFRRKMKIGSTTYPLLAFLVILSGYANSDSAMVRVQIRGAIDQPVAASHPAPRYVHQMMTYDESNQQMLLFGGAGENASYGDLWTWDGRIWWRLSETGPQPRNSGILVYDSRRKRTVLFGGRGETEFSDTWEWDGSRWHLADRQGPTPRLHSAAAFDRKRGVVVLFGPLLASGYLPRPLLNETWTWDGRRWAKIATTGPADCTPIGMIFDQAKDRVLLFVCKFAATPSGMPLGPTELWEWTGTDWRQISTTSPSVTSVQSNIAVAGPPGGVLIFDGDSQNGAAGVTWYWDYEKWQKVSTRGPSTRFATVMVYDRARQQVVLFGGGTAHQLLNDTWLWDGKQWAQIK